MVSSIYFFFQADIEKPQCHRMSLTYLSYIEVPYSAPVFATKPIYITLFCPEVNPHEMFHLLVLMIKSENSLNQKTNVFACDRFHMHCRIYKFCITCWKLTTNIELQYCVSLRANLTSMNLETFQCVLKDKV